MNNLFDYARLLFRVLAENKGTLALVNEVNVFVGTFYLDRAQIDSEMCWNNRTNRRVPVKISIYDITKDCARSRLFQDKLQYHFYQL